MTYCYKFPNGSFTLTDEDLPGWSFRWTVNEDEQARIEGGATVSEADGVLAVGPMPAPIPVAAEAVPSSVRSAQLAQWLVENDKMATVDYVFATPAYWPNEKTRLKAKIRWEREVSVNRDDAMVFQLAKIIFPAELTDAELGIEIDKAFIAADKIE